MERASDTCERKSGRSGRSELRYAMSETSEENDMAAAVGRAKVCEGGRKGTEEGNSWGITVRQADSPPVMKIN